MTYLEPVTPRCRRCGGSCVDWDGEGLTCILCAPPYVKPDTSGIRLVRDDAADIGSIIAREHRAIRSAAAAGRRIWA